ncbi:hypothetical protein CHUAL_013210 [Chamberlinius hualienensis]
MMEFNCRFKWLLEDLSTVVMFNAIEERKGLNGVREVLSEKIKDRIDKVEFTFFDGSMNNFTILKHWFHLLYETVELVFEDPFIVDLIKEPVDRVTKKPKYDIVVIDGVFNDFTLAIAHHLGVPSVIFTTTGFFYHHVWFLNIPHPLSYIPSFSSAFAEPMSFVDRTLSAFSNLFLLIMMKYVSLPNNDIIVQKHLPHTPPTTELIRNVSFIFSHTHPSFNSRMPSMPFTAEVGGINCKPPKPLPKDLEDYMTGADDHGVIYFSLGSVTKGDAMPLEMRNKMIETFSRLPQRIIWKYEKDIPDLPKNIKLMKWAPQNDLLAHPNMKLFITHGGLLSINEAIYNGCPIFGFPLSADQLYNMAMVKVHGIGDYLDWKTFTSQELLQIIRKILADKGYKEKSMKKSIVFKDRLQNPIETAAYWIEYVARHNGAHFLKPSYDSLNFFQYFLLDVIGAVFAVIILVGILLMKFTSVFVFLLVVCSVQCYNVLFMLPFGSKSHKNVFDPVAEELVKRGHNVVMFTSLEVKGETNGVKHVLAKEIKTMIDTVQFSFFQGSMNNFSLMTSMFGLFYEITDIVLKDPFIVDLIKEPLDPVTNKPKYDIVIVDGVFNDFSLVFAHHMGVPNIIFSTSGYFYHHVWNLNIPHPISYIPTAFSDISEPMNFADRLRSSFSNLVFVFLINNIFLPNNDVVIRKYLPDSPPLIDLIKNVSFIFTHTHPAFNFRVPSMPYTAEVGGLNCKPTKPLPKDLEDFMQSAGQDGVIYFSLGSLTKGETMPNEMKEKILEVFSQLPQKIIWKYEKPIPDLPKNIKLVTWAPQTDILGHSNIRLFITHGGLLSINEAIYSGCPLLGFPLSADQLSNMALVRKHGIGDYLDWKTFTTKNFTDSINKILTDKSYKERTLQKSTVFRDQLQNPAEKAAYWIEYVVRHDGASFLKSSADTLNFFQYFILDVIVHCKMAKYTTIALILLFGCHVLDAYNILFMLPFSSKSHKNVFDPVTVELAQRGHKVAVFSPFDHKLNVSGIENHFNPAFNDLFVKYNVDFFQGSANSWAMLSNLFNMVYDMIDTTYTDPFIANIIKEPRDPSTGKPKFDIVIVDAVFNDFALPLAHHMDVPSILFSPGTTFLHHAWNLNIPMPFSVFPSHTLDLPEPLSFTHRALNAFACTVFITMINHFTLPHEDAVIRKYLPNSPPLVELEKNVSFLISNIHPPLSLKKPLMPYAKDIGGINCYPAKPLPKNLEDFMQSAGKDGVIYFSLGSYTKGESMPPEMRDKIVKAFAQIPQKVLWKYEKEIPSLSSNVKLIKWAPQQDLLAHPQLRLFISHGGGLSCSESAYHGSPVLGFPLSADQHGNMAQAKKLGMAESLDWQTFTSQELVDVIKQMLNDKRYKEKAMFASKLLKDRPIKPVEETAYWIEYVIRHNGAHFLKRMMVQLTLFIVAAFLPVLLVTGCETDSECGNGNCCRQRIAGVSFFKGCVEFSQPDGRCGGQTRCQCITGYKCEPDKPGFFKRFIFGNGSCLLDFDVQQENQRRVFIDV